MERINVNDLISIHLRYGAGAEPLRVRAFAQMVSKILYLSQDTTTNISGIDKGIAEVLNCSSVSKQQIYQALKFLESKNLAEEQGNYWRLTNEGLSQIKTDLNRSFQRLQSVLTKHFPQRLDQKILHLWFSESCVEFFAKYGDRWVASVCRGVPLKSNMPTDFRQLLSPIVSKHNFDYEIEALLAGFRSFLTSPYPEDNEQLWNLGQAMFASRLVAANISADPFTIHEIRNATILLDTNVLIAASLEKHRLAEALLALSTALCHLGVKLHYLFHTRDEYINSIDYHAKMITAVSKKFSEDVIQKSIDPFLRTALDRGCKDPEDFERFFSTVKDPPTSFDDSANISLLDFPDIKSAVDKGTNNAELKKGISDAWISARHRVKKQRAIEHDAGLLTAGEHLRHNGEKCWILTLDRTFHDFDLKRTGINENPLLLSLDVLIQILAIETIGPKFDASQYGPILASIIEYQFEPLPDTYAPEDLAWLLDIEERCYDLPTEQVEELARQVNRARLTGKSHDDAELRLQIQRSFQAKKSDLTKKLETTTSRLQFKEEEAKKVTSQLSSTQLAYAQTRKRELLKTARTKLMKSIIKWLSLSLVLSGLGVFITFSVSNGGLAEFVGILVSALGPAFISIFTIFQNILPDYRKELLSIDKTIKDELDIIAKQ